MVPTWVAVVTGIGGLIASAIITPFITLAVARRGDATARRGQNQDLIKQAAELFRSDEPRAQRVGLAMLNAISQMKDLSADEARLVQTVIRSLTEPVVSRAQELSQRGETVELELEVGPLNNATESGGGDDEGPGD